MVEIQFGDWAVLVSDGCLPINYLELMAAAGLSDEFDVNASDGRASFLCIWNKASRRADPVLAVSQRYEMTGSPAAALLVPQSNRVFIGAGERLLCYDIAAPKRIWEDYALEFWSWEQATDRVVMRGELEIVVWTTSGRKLWSVPSEPEWTHVIEGRTVVLNGDGARRVLGLDDGLPIYD